MLNLGKKPSSQAAQELKNWYKDRYQNAVVWRNIFAVVTLAALLISLASVLAVYQLTPLKSVEPFVIQVDEKTGITQVVNPLSTPKLISNESISRYFVAQYVRARESYDPNPAVIQESQNTVRLMTINPKTYAMYKETTRADNPDNFVNRLGAEGVRSVEFKSIAFLDAKTAIVKATVTERTRDYANTLHKQFTVTFDYQKMELKSNETLINPLGFAVNRYTVDDEVAP